MDYVGSVASLSSTIGDDLISASGRSYVQTYSEDMFNDGAASVTHTVTFDLLAPVEYYLSILLDASFSDMLGGTGGYGSLTGPSGTIFSGSLPPQMDFGGGVQSGTLEPGRYTLEASVSSSEAEYTWGPQVTNFSLEFGVTVVPEPSTTLLVLSGLVALASVRRQAWRG